MNVRYAFAFAAALAVSLIAIAPLRADAPKQLENMKGSVSFQAAQAAAKPVALKAIVSLADSDYTITGEDSLAQLTLPDSSQISIGSDTKVQLASFNQADITTAKFVVVNGKTRFAVRHPAGAKANYTFQTPTGTVAVRGTQGDIAYDQTQQQLRVNVYEVCDPKNPVVVTLRNGKTLTLIQGQTALAHLVNGVIQAEVDQLTQQLINQFSPDFGVPTSWDAAKGEIVSYAAGAASSAAGNAINGATGTNVGGNVVNGVSNLFKKKATPTPAPTQAAKPATCS